MRRALYFLLVAVATTIFFQACEKNTGPADSKENEEIIGWMHTLERQTINVEEKHLKIERKID